MSLKQSKFISFNDAKKIVHKFGIKTRVEWNNFSKSGKRQKNIPARPDQIYKKDWISWGDFLGTGSIAFYKIRYASFEEVKKFARSHKIKSEKQWYDLCKSGKKPNNVPRNIYKVYKEDWTTWGDFLGTGTLSPKGYKDFYTSFEEAKKFARSNKIKSEKQWYDLCKSGKKPNNVPVGLESFYKEDWTTWGDFLGTEVIAPQNYVFSSFKEAKKFIRSHKIKSEKQWMEFSKSGKRPKNIPANPQRVYKKYWKGWGDFLGTGSIASYNKKFDSFEKAREFACSLKLKTVTEWFNFCKSGKKPKTIPTHVNNIYKDKWLSWSNFLGSEIPTEIKFLSYENAQKVVQSLEIKSEKQWYDLCKSGKRPKNIPSNLSRVYKKDWISWGDFLGTGFIFASKQKLVKKVFYELERNWKFYSRWTDGLIQDWFDELGVYTSSDPYIRSFFRKFIDFRKKHEGRKALMFWIQTKRFSVPFGEFRLQGNVSLINPIEKRNYVRQKNSPILDEDNLSALTIIKEIKDINQLISNQHTTDLQIKYTIQLLWRAVFDQDVEKKEIKKLKRIKQNKNKFHNTVLQKFLNEYNQVKSIKNPSNYIGKFKPTLMQLYTAWKMSKTNSFFNLSRSGTGKTLAGLLASRNIKSRYTLVICPNSILKQWFDVIDSSFNNTVISTGKYIHNYNKGTQNYHILNYNKLSQLYTINLIKEITVEKIDFIIIDETHNVKIRHESTISDRRKNIEKLIKSIRKKNKNVKILCISATPSINNIREGRSLLEIVTNKKHNEIGNEATIRNASKLHTAFIPHSIRYLEKYPIKVNEKTNGKSVNAIIPNNISNETIRKYTWLQFEQIATQARIPEIKKHLKKRTIIYTEFVSGITDELIKAIKQEGFSVGLYTGTEKSGLEAFKHELVDVLISSSTIAEGVDQLQLRCNNIIFNSLPYTYARYEQIVGRLVRKNQTRKTVNVIIIPSKIEGFEYDQKVKINRILFKKEIGKCITDGILPQKIQLPKGGIRKKLIQKILSKRNSLLIPIQQGKML